MKIIKTTLVAGLISLFATFSTFAEKVKIGDPGCPPYIKFLRFWKSKN